MAGKNKQGPYPRDEALLSQLHFIRRLTRDLVHDAHTCEDIAQDVALAALKKPPDVPGTGSAWLHTVIKRVFQLYTRSEKRRKHHELLAPVPEGVPSAETVAEVTETCEVVARLVRGLEEPCRSAIFLRYYEDLPASKIAKMTDVSARTVNMRIQQGLELLRERMDSKYGDRHAWLGLLAPLILREAVRPPLILVVKAALAAAMLIPAILVVKTVLENRTIVPDTPGKRMEATKSGKAVPRPLIATANPPGQPDPGTGSTVLLVEKSGAEQPAKASASISTPGTLSISGRVRDQFGIPLDGIWVRAKRKGQKIQVQTDRQGLFTLSGLGAGNHTVTVRTYVSWDPDGLSKYWAEGTPELAVREVDAGATNVDFRLKFGAVVAGTFTSTRTGKRLDIPVCPRIDRKKECIREALPGLMSRNGRYVILLKHAGMVSLAFNPHRGELCCSVWKTREVAVGQWKELPFEFEPGGEIRGTVKHAAGKEFRLFQIDACDEQTEKPLRTFIPDGAFRRTGEYRIPGLPERTVYLRVSALGYPDVVMRGIQIIKENSTTRDIEIRDGGYLHLRVLDAAGKAITDFTPVIQSQTTGESYKSFMKQDSGNGKLESISDDFTVLLLPDRYVITVRSRTETQKNVCKISAGKTAEVTFTMKR